MILLMFAAIAGGILTASVTAPFGVAVSLLSAPFGGSLCAVLAAVYLARQPGDGWQSQTDLDEQTDAMVAALREIAAQAELGGGMDATSEGNLKVDGEGVRAA